MAFQIGFVLVTYNEPEQTAFLCKRLSEQFGDPPIALHHDYGQSDLPRASLPANVHVVQRWKRTRWGHISVVEAVIAAIRMMYEKAAPTWCVSLSTTDYLVKAPEAVCAAMRSSSADAFLDHRVLRPERVPHHHVRAHAASFSDPAWVALAYDRYVSTPLIPRFVARGIRLPVQRMPYLRTAWARHSTTPFKNGFLPFGGDSWFSFNQRAARAFIEDTPELASLRRHFAGKGIPEESFYHSLLCNRPELSIDNRNYRYVDWTGGGNHPKLLGRGDLTSIVASGAHFARRFPFDPVLYRELDRLSAGSTA